MAKHLKWITRQVSLNTTIKSVSGGGRLTAWYTWLPSAMPYDDIWSTNIHQIRVKYTMCHSVKFQNLLLWRHQIPPHIFMGILESLVTECISMRNTDLQVCPSLAPFGRVLYWSIHLWLNWSISLWVQAVFKQKKWMDNLRTKFVKWLGSRVSTKNLPFSSFSWLLVKWYMTKWSSGEWEYVFE